MAARAIPIISRNRPNEPHTRRGRFADPSARPRRRSKDEPGGRDEGDVRFVKDGVARAIRTLQAATTPEPEDRVVPLSPQMVGLRFTAAAAAAGVERVTAGQPPT